MKALDDALAAADPTEQLKLLAAVPAKDRTELIDAVRAKRESFKKELSSMREGAPEEWQIRKEELVTKFQVLEAAALVAHQDRKQLPAEFHPSDILLGQPEIFDFLAAARPEWLAALFLSKDGYGSRVSGRELSVYRIYDEASAGVVVRYLEAGLIPTLPEEDWYYSRLPTFVSVHAAGKIAPARQYLLENPGIVPRDLPICIRLTAQQGLAGLFFWEKEYRYFDRELRQTTTLVSEDGFSVMKVVGELCVEGCFDHRPILATMTETLVDVQREHEARAVVTVHEQFAPPPAFCLDLQHSYFMLLASPHKAVVKFAVETIGGFRKLAGFDAGAFIEQVGQVFSHDSNPLQIAALNLVRGVMADHPGDSERVPGAIAPALLNANAKVQSAVLEVFKALPGSCGGLIGGALSPFADRILPSLRPEFAKWMLEDGPQEEKAAAAPAVASGRERGARMEPVGSADELGFVASELLNREPDPMRFEQFLDGLSRFAADHRAAISGMFKSLEKRAVGFSKETDPNSGGYALLVIFAAKIIRIFGPNPPEACEPIDQIPLPEGTPGHAKQTPARAMRFACARIDEVVKGIREGRKLPLLALPEFELGFISRGCLLDRFKVYQQAGVAPGHFDFIQAIARCDMEGEDAGALELPESDDEASRVLRFLFSGEVRGAVETPAWWLAAARTREPDGDFSKHPLFGCRDGENLPDWWVPVLYSNPPSTSYRWGRDSPLLSWMRDEAPADHLYPLQHGGAIGKYGCYGSDLRWRYSFTPGLLDAVIGQDLQYSLQEDDLTEKTSVNAISAVMSELARRRPPPRHTMRVHLLMALNSRSRVARESAVDLFIQASGDGRLAAALPEMGDMFSHLMQGDEDPECWTLEMARLVPSLRQLSSGDSVLRMQLRDILLRGLENPPKSIPKGFPALLELVLELVLAHRPERLPDLNTAWNGMLDGKSKSLAARISKA